MTVPAGYTFWVADQSVYYWIDNSSTAEYGIDYKMSGGRKDLLRPTKRTG